MDRLLRRLRDALETEVDYGTPFLFVPVLLCCGSLAYFSADFEPGWSSLILGLILLALIARAMRGWRLATSVSIALAILITGALAAKIQTWRASTKMLASPVATTLTGNVVAIDRQSGGRARIVIDITSTERPVLRYAPDRVRIVSRKPPSELRPGMTISGRARLIPHSGPVHPNGFDFTFHNYFRGFGAVGFFLGEPRVWDTVEPFAWQPAVLLQRLRDNLTERIKQRIGGSEGEITAALITGAKSGIPEDINEALRRTGLAHILSISGLHMALVAGTVIAVLRLAFALFPEFASRHPVRKFAAIAALATVSFYLFISGASIATQRSFLMLAVMLIALLFDRPAITMRNLAIAAIIVILLQPHEVAGPSFQMSFAATAALVAAYAAWTRRRARLAERGQARATDGKNPAAKVARKILAYATALAVTSIVAGAATAIYGVWHFHRLAPLGLFANLAAMPVVSLLIMPSAVLGVVLIPFDLDGPAFAAMGQGISLVVAIAVWFSERTPVDAIGMIPVASVTAASLGLVLATLPVTRLKLLCLPLFAAAFGFAIFRPLPDIYIEEAGKLVAFTSSDGDLAVNRSRARGFIMGIWKHAAPASGNVRPIKTDDPIAAVTSGKHPSETFLCGEKLCLARLANGTILAHAKSAADAAPACRLATLIVVEDAAAPAGFCSTDKPASAAAPRIVTARDLAHHGAMSVRFGSTGEFDVNQGAAASPVHRTVKINTAISKPWRPWHAHRAYSREARGLPPYRPRKRPAKPTRDENQ